MSEVEVPKSVSALGGWLDDRLHGTAYTRKLMRKVVPDHWSFILGEITLWSFVILLLTGTFLSLFFVPSMTEVTYHGSYTKLDGIRMSEAYQSTLRISFDVRGGNFLGHTLTLSVLIPFVLPLTIIIGGAAIWPWFEAWATGDKAVHHILDRPRNVPVRTGIGVAAVVFYGVLWVEGANDVISDKLQIPLYTVTRIAPVLVIAGPVLAFFVTRRICLGLQHKDRERLVTDTRATAETAAMATATQVMLTGGRVTGTRMPRSCRRRTARRDQSAGRVTTRPRAGRPRPRPRPDTRYRPAGRKSQNARERIPG